MSVRSRRWPSTMTQHKSAETTAVYTHLTDRTRDRLDRALDELTDTI